jgi:putative transposase
MSRARYPYPSDLSDTEWALLEPLLASSERRGRPPKWSARHIADAVFYLLRSGCAWRMLPREYPPWQTVYYHFRRWRIDGRLRRAHDRITLRRDRFAHHLPVNTVYLRHHSIFRKLSLHTPASILYDAIAQRQIF